MAGSNTAEVRAAQRHADYAITWRSTAAAKELRLFGLLGPWNDPVPRAAFV
jgi:hypothetical protein